MAVSNIVYAGSTLIDLTADTVTAASLLQGVTAHDKAGNAISGAVVVQTYYTGSTTPASSLGVNGDLYLKV